MNSSLPLLLVALFASSPLLAQDPPKPKGEMPLTGDVSEAEFKALHELTGEKAPPPKGEMIEVPGVGKVYLSLPKEVKAPMPAVLVIHEWWGLNGHIKHWADRVAGEGYAAVAVDLYGGKVATNRDEAMASMQSVKPAESEKLLLAAHAFLKSDPRIQATKRGVMGWCFGGKNSLALAMAAPDLDASVIYYGQLVTDSERLKTIKAKVLGIFGTKDTGISNESVNAFEAGLKAAGVTHEILRYDAVHAFANPSNPRYDAKSAGDAWARVKTFFAANLKKS